MFFSGKSNPSYNECISKNKFSARRRQAENTSFLMQVQGGGKLPSALRKGLL